MSLEALGTKLDSLLWENSQLEIENRRLWEMQPEEQVVQELETAKRDMHMARSRAAESEDPAKKLAKSLAQETAQVRELESELDHRFI